MIRRIFSLTAIAAVVLAAGSCSTDLDAIDDWKETTVVYGVLNQHDSVQYIKVTKAFLGEGDATVMAQQFDSLYYDTTKLVVTLTEVQTGLIDTLDPEMSIPHSMSGPDPIFGEQQVLYKTAMPLNDDYTYKLNVKNLASGNEVSGQTKLVKPVSVLTPQAFSTYVDMVNPPNYPFKIKWSTSENGRRYQAVMRFHYEEKNKLTGAIDTTKYMDIVFPDQLAPNLTGGTDMEVSMERTQLFQTLGAANLNTDPTIERHPRGIEFLFYVAADDLNTYIEVSKPSTGIVQEKATFTNINNGIGIFSSRLTQLANNKRYILNAVSSDSLCIGRFTKKLHFCNPSEFNPADPCYCEP